MIPAVRILLSRLREVGQQFGTLSDQTLIAAAFNSNPEIISTPISEHDISLFRRVVETGIVNHIWLIPPRGYRVLGFLIALRDYQQQQYANQVEAQHKEIISIMVARWEREIEESGGCIDTAKKSMREKFNVGRDEHLREIMNQSFVIATK